MCNATGGGCEPAARAVTTNVTDDGSLYGSSEALALKPGTRYYSTVAATGCGGVTARSRSETGVVCDESPPVVLGLPTIRSVGDTAALPLPGRAVVKWAGVFSDDESGGKLLVQSEKIQKKGLSIYFACWSERDTFDFRLLFDTSIAAETWRSCRNATAICEPL